MNAAVADVGDAVSRKRQAKSLADRLLYLELKALLGRWGDWLERHKDDTGLPTAASFTLIPGGYWGHRILCAEMPTRVAAVHRQIVKLDEDDRYMLMSWYGCQRTEEGGWLDNQEKARLMGISFSTFRCAVYQARQRLFRTQWFV